MATKKLKAFDIATNAEMRKLLPDSRFQRATLRASRVPQNIRDLIPLAERWGITCDVTRHEVAEGATEAEFKKLRKALDGRHPAIYDFLYSDDKDASEEIAVFSALLTFEMEECDGPGIPSAVDYWYRKYREDPSGAHREKLEKKVKELRAMFKRDLPDYYKKKLSEIDKALR